MTEKQVLLHKGDVNVSATELGEKWTTVKFIPALFVVLLLVSGCDEPNLNNPIVRNRILAEALPAANLQTRRTPSGEEMFYAPNEQEPYTGWVKEQKHKLWGIRDGKRHGKWAEWYYNGQKKSEGSYEDGKRHGKWTQWDDNGQMASEENYQEDKKHGKWAEWYYNGQKRRLKEAIRKIRDMTNGSNGTIMVKWHRKKTTRMAEIRQMDPMGLQRGKKV